MYQNETLFLNETHPRNNVAIFNDFFACMLARILHIIYVVVFEKISVDKSKIMDRIVTRALL